MANAWPDYSGQSAQNGKPEGQNIAAFPAIVSASPPPAKRKQSRIRLENGPQIRREMTKVYRGMKNGEIDITKATKMIYALEVLSRTLERENVERLAERLDAVEGK